MDGRGIEIHGPNQIILASQDELIEASRNFYAICDETKDVYYLGEEVDRYTGGQLSSHKGVWLAKTAQRQA